LVYLRLLQVYQDGLAHFEQLLLDGVLVDGETALLLVLIGEGTLEGGDGHGAFVGEGGGRFTAVGESGGGAGDLRVEDSFGEFLDVVYFLFLSNQEAKIRVSLSQFLKLGSD
jgi:hypothetical protein